ncbi:granzyme G [Kryptolebias marmoratus]|uniref:trypsin n=1 Tax=Kryptolebias marmoratus TaxID=37003 RepID=A0A3Q3EXV1_KRYMA|nr:granzyme G [Kryptolebias marmoratus]
MLKNSRLAALVVVLILLGQVHAGRIIGGKEALAHSRPYMVLLERQTLSDKEFCGGFLLNEDFVMTAGHCQAKTYNALLGLHYMHQNKEQQKISVQREFLHEDFDRNTLSNDLMLLKLSSKAKFTKNVKPIDLADQDEGSLPQQCSVAGWGKTDWNSNLLSTKLMEVNVTLIKNENCAQNHFYCSEGMTGPFQGDSGGPLVCEDGKAYGLVSHLTINQNYIPDYRFTKIPDYIDWIMSTMKKN